MDHAPAGLLACPECDLLQRIPAPSQAQPGRTSMASTVSCARCQALFWHESRGDRGHALALSGTGLLLLVLANVFPLASFDLGGSHVETTLAGLVRALVNQDMHALGALVFLTLVVAPALQLAALFWLLLPLSPGRKRPGSALASRLLPATRPWSMVEVFMLGALVSLVKLADVATLKLGPALAALGALMLVMSAAYARFDVRELWDAEPAR
jgi:paraquat-inducible protein A